MGKPRKPRVGAETVRAPERKPVKRRTNLTLDPEALARGERFSERHGTSLSQLVTDFLYSLCPAEADEAVEGLSPPVRRLYGVAAGGTADREAHRAHLMRKYGKR
jgi:hypothetical protein